MRNNLKSIIFSIAGCFLFFIFCFWFSFWFWSGIYEPVSKNPGSVVNFVVERGAGAEKISQNLKEQKIIKNALLFRVYVLLSGDSKKLQAGEYQLSPSMNMSEITEKLLSGKVVKKTITLIEGWDYQDIADYLKEKGFSVGQEETETLKQSDGYIFPDTYEISPQDGVGEVIKKARDNFEKKLTAELRDKIIKQKKSVAEIVIMASMLEKEVKTLEDKKIVAGVLYKRLKIGMPLQVDATVNYATGNKSSSVSINDTKVDSLYNTYKYKGLPPGPISNPGIDSIVAAIEPQTSVYWFYLSTSDGKTIFSKTLVEHNAAKAKYLR
jgi:UPF0755 protein